jgi:RNA polymerase sigma-70 factor (ECF subfamily)
MVNKSYPRSSSILYQRLTRMMSLTMQRVRRILATEAGLSEGDFIHLYQGHLDRVFNYVRYRLGPGEAEDVTADIFVRAWARRREYDPHRGTPGTWLWAIARNMVTDRLRRHRPQYVELSADLAGRHNPPVEIEKEEEWQQVRGVMVQLPAVDQEIIALRFGAGHTNRTIAELTGLSEANVAQRLRRALRKMRTHLQRDDTS